MPTWSADQSSATRHLAPNKGGFASSTPAAMHHNAAATAPPTNGRLTQHTQAMFDRVITVSPMNEDDERRTRQMTSSDDDEKENDGHSNGLSMEARLLQKGYAYDENWCDTPSKGESGGGGGRSGRRKQSKPARVFLTMDGLEGEQADPAKPVDMSNRPGSVDGTPASKARMEVDEPLPCDLCNSNFPTQSALTDHIQTSHNLNQSEQASKSEESDVAYPTRYHQLGSQLQQEVSVFADTFPNNNKDECPERTTPSTTPSHTPVSKSPDSNASDATSSNKSRIFHQDAYCKMCDREFCNKYFLKIHMANKHGIYEEGLGLMPGVMAASSADPFVSTPLSASVTKPTYEQPHPTPPKAPVLPPLPLLAPATSSVPLSVSTPHKTSSSSARSSKSGPDMEDYCEICQKHFCNKYYLRKHKHDVHGIVPEALSSGGKKSRNSSNNSSNHSSNSSSMSSNVPAMTSGGPPPLMLPQQSPIITSGSMNGANPIPGLTSMANVMFINPFAPPVAILQTQSVMQPGAGSFPQPPPGLPGMPPLCTTAPVFSSISPKSACTTSSIPPNKEMHNATEKSSIRTPTSLPMPNSDALRGMGLLGAEATCEVCHKEFCNKYFLSIHKANKHNIFTEDGPGPLLLPGISPGLPENLSMRGGPELGETTPQKPIKSEGASAEGSPTGEEEVCEICLKEFSSKFSLKVHLINAHNIKPHDNELFKLDKINGGQSVHSTMFSNMIAAKLADRVTCEVCNKEVCNKYFLKTHKMKVHGMSPNEAEKERDVQKSTPSKASPAPGIPNSPAEAAKEVLQRPNDDELLKMGIDPEAYCEICRKEFCSKYFLKTHKANIHGIKSESSYSSQIKMPDKNMMPLMMPSLAQMGLRPSHSSLMPGMLPLLPGHGSQMPDLQPQLLEQDKSSGHWKWKEPVNQTRVLCDICNKELCNKYFLKTHLLKRHGINYDVITGKSSAANPDFLASRDADSSNDTSSADPTPQPPPVSSPEDMSKDSNHEEGPEDMTTVVSAKTWPIPQVPHTADKASPKLAMEPTSAPQTSSANFALQKCPLCGVMFGELLALQFHMVRDHQGRVLVEPVDKPIEDTSNVSVRIKRKYELSRAQMCAKRRCITREPGKNKSRNKGPHQCPYCKKKFMSFMQQKQHVRAEHKLPSKRRKNNGGQKMQAFTLQEQAQGEPHFATWQVYLPVLERISQPLSATFTLTPTPKK